MNFNDAISTIVGLYKELDPLETPRNCSAMLNGMDPLSALRKGLLQLKATSLDGSAGAFDLALLTQELEGIDLAGP